MSNFLKVFSLLSFVTFFMKQNNPLQDVLKENNRYSLKVVDPLGKNNKK